MKKSLFLLLLIAHFCSAVSRAQEPLAIHLKDFHTAPITDVLVDTDERFIYSGDQSGKILVTRTLDYGFHKTLLKRADGMAIKDMRLTNHDSILLILTGYRYALGRADSLLVFDTNRHQVARSMPVHDATFGSGTDGLLLLASGNGQNNEITGFANNDLTQNILTLSCAGIPKLPAASIGKHWLAFIETAGNLFEQHLKVVDYTNHSTLFEEEFADVKNEAEIIFLHASVDGEQLYAFVYETTTSQLSIYGYGTTGFAKTKLQSFPFSKVGTINVEHTLGSERSVFVISSDNNFGQQPLVLSLANQQFNQIELSVNEQISTGTYVSAKENVVLWSMYRDNIDNLVRYFVYDANDSRLLDQYPSEDDQVRSIASFLPNNNIWITNHNGQHPINKYYPAGTYDNRFGLLGLEDYLTVYHETVKYPASESVLDEQSGDMVFVGRDQTDGLTARYFCYNLLADRIEMLSDQEAQLTIPISYAGTKKRLLASDSRYFDRAGYEPRSFTIIDPTGSIDLQGAFKHGVLSNNGDFVMTVDSANILQILALPDLSVQLADTLENGDFRLFALDQSSFAVGLSKQTVNATGCNQETRFYLKEAGKPFQRQLHDCVFPEDITLKDDVMAAIFKGAGVIVGEHALDVPPDALPLALSLNDDASRMLLSYQSGKIEIYATDSLRLLGTMYHPDQHAHVFFDKQGHYFSNIEPGDFIYATRNHDITPLPASDTTYYNPLKALAMLGPPRPDYMKTLAKALAIRQRYQHDTNSTSAIGPEIRAVLVNGDQNRASSDLQETDIAVLTDRDIQTIILSLNGVPLPDITARPNTNHRYDFKVTLSQAVNTVKLTVVDAAGIASFATEKTIHYNGQPLEADLYVLAVGVSDYKQSDYNLTFADKDALDFIKLYGGLADTAYMKYEDKFFGTRYQLIQNGINQPLQEIRNFREYSGVNGLLGVDRLGRRWLEMNGKQAKLWDFTTESTYNVDLPPALLDASVFATDKLLAIEPEGNGFYGHAADSLYYYSFGTNTFRSLFAPNWTTLGHPILLSGGRWVTAEHEMTYRDWGTTDSITVHIAENDGGKWEQQVHPIMVSGSLAPTLQAATADGKVLWFSTIADTIICAEWDGDTYQPRKIRLSKQFEYGDILEFSPEKEQISLLRNYFIEDGGKDGNGESGYRYYTFDLHGKLLDSLHLPNRAYAIKGVHMANGSLYHVSTLQPIAASRNLFSMGEDTLLTNAGPASFVHTYTRYLVNEQATDTAIRETIRSFFRSAKPADQVVVFLAGHGVLDSAYNFHYAAHNMDFGRVSANGVALQEVIEEVGKSPANRKLLLIDACHSGNVFDHIEMDTTHTTGGQNGERGSKSIRSRSSGKNDIATLITTLFDNFTSSSGLTILSASAGTDVAYENPSLSNGAFTTSFLDALNNELKKGSLFLDPAALDRPVILTDKLINRIQKKVIQVTNKKQTPDIREINPDVQIAIW